MEIIDYLLARKKAGGGSDVTIEQLSVTENGTYSEEGIAYSPVVVNVPAPANSYQLKDAPSGTVSTIDDGTALPMSSLKVGIEPQQEGSGDPSPDNIRPISGWTAANVTRCGKNLFGGLDMANAIYDVSYNSIINTVDGTVSFTRCVQNDDGSFIRPFFKVLFDDIVTLIITYKNTGINNSLIFLYSDGSTDQISLMNTNGEKRTYIRASSPDKPIIAVGLSYYTANVTYIYYEESGIFKGNITNADYEPYNGQTYTIQFKDGDNPLTVYGGTLDVTSGELVVDRMEVDLGTIQADAWSRYSPETTNLPVFFAYVRGILPSSAMKNKSSIYKCLRWEPLNNRTDFSLCVHPTLEIIYIADSRYTTVDEFATATNGVQLVYELAEPITYHLTPTQIRTLVGNNNIWADTGNIIEGSYFKSLT